MMTYDPNVGGELLFGGYDYALFSNQTWEFKKGNWSVLSPSSSPSKRAFGAMVYDPADNYTLLFGGFDGNILGETWKYANGSWFKLSPTSSPSPRDFPSVAYDPAIRAVVLFGGSNVPGNPLNDTWTFSAGNWTNVTPASGTIPHLGGEMAYDAVDGYLLLVGSTASENLGESWNYSGGVWTKIVTVGTPPAPGGNCMIAYDGSRSVIELYSGTDQFGGAGTWTYRAGIWTQYFPLPAPAPAYVAAMAYDPGISAVVVTGGEGGYGSAAFALVYDTWAVGGTTWTLLMGQKSPRPINGQSMTYDSADGYALVFGGQEDPISSFGAYIGQTWGLSAGNWTLERPAGSPSSRLGASLAFDPQMNETVLFGGSTNSGSSVVNDTWVYQSGNWTRLPTIVAPSPRVGALLVFDPNSSALILFGGTDGASAFNDTWKFQNGTWTKLTPESSPSGRAWAAGSYDYSNGEIVLFGGCRTVYGGPFYCFGSFVNDTWTFQGGSWGLQATQGPPAQAGDVLASLPGVASLPLYDGSYGGTQTWFLRNGTWTAQNLTPGPRLRLFESMAGDPASGVFWLVGGTGNQSSLLWELVPPSVLRVGFPMANRSIGDIGQSVSISVAVQGVSGVPSFSWAGLPGCPSLNASSFNCTLNSTGRFYIQATVRSTGGQVTTSGVLVLTVNSVPIVSAPIATPARLFVGERLSLSILATGGTGNILYAWRGLPPGCSSVDSPLISCNPSLGGTWAISVLVTDSAGVRGASPSLTVDVLPDPALQSLSSSRPTADVGQSILFTTAAVGSVGRGEFSWAGLPPGCVSANSTRLTCTPAGPSHSSVVAELTYALGLTATSVPTPFAVFADPTLSTPHSSVPFAADGDNVTFWVTLTNGSGNWTISWSGLPAGCASLVGSNTTTVTCAPQKGNYSISASLVDSNGFAVNGTSLQFSVGPARAPVKSPKPLENSSAPLSPWLYIALGVGGLGGLVGVLFYLRRRRG